MAEFAFSAEGEVEAADERKVLDVLYDLAERLGGKLTHLSFAGPSGRVDLVDDRPAPEDPTATAPASDEGGPI